MSDESHQMASIPLSRFPGPACSYTVRNEVLVLTATNDSFTRNFGSGWDATPVAEFFEAEDLQVANAPSLDTLLRTDGAFDVAVTDTDSDTPPSFLVTTIGPTSEKPGYLLFSEQRDNSSSDASQTLGMDHVASVLSHDLRNPLDVAKARLDAGRELDEDEHFEHVERAHDRMERIIQDVLTMARGEEVVDPDETVELAAIAEEAWGTVESNGATVTIEEDLPQAMADPDRVTRVFENLFRNSIEHGQTADGVQSADDVVIRVGPLDESMTGFYVADNGPGIPADERDSVFEPGYSSDEHGIGLGLAIVAQIADLHGWSVTITSSASDGARFEFEGLETV
jgi:signal transduction histidine kinase